jgi:hypothetical protein
MELVRRNRREKAIFAECNEWNVCEIGQYVSASTNERIGGEKLGHHDVKKNLAKKTATGRTT